MKGTKLLSLITAGAIVATVGVSFAAWDKLSDTKAVTLNVAKQVSVAFQSTDLSFGGDLATTDATNGGTQTADFTVNVTNKGDVDQLTLAAANVKLMDTTDKEVAGDAATAALSKVQISFKEGDTALTDGKDTTISEGANSYKVEVAVDAAATADDIAALAGNKIAFDITATADKAATA